jgi:hypothetical protein
MLIEFDQTTMAKMTAALEPSANGFHQRRIATRCANRGRHGGVREVGTAHAGRFPKRRVEDPAGVYTAAEVSLVRLETAVWFKIGPRRSDVAATMH